MDISLRAGLGHNEPVAARGGAAQVELRRMRVALVSGSYNYIKDGVALTLNRLVDFLLRSGVEVLVFAPVARTPAFESVGAVVPVTSIPLPFRSEYRVALGLPAGARKHLEDFAPHIIHIATPDLLGYAALKFARANGLPVVASYHTRYETYLRHYGLGFAGPLVERYLRSFYEACHELYVPSSSMGERLAADGLQVEMRLWPRGVDANNFRPSRRSLPWRARYGLRADDFVVLFVSRLVREKQLGTLADTLLKLKERGVAHRSVIVGDGPERAWLEKRLPESIFTGFLIGDELATAYASSDVFLFPSDTESFGNVTLEAMASGLPTVCANATGSRSLVAPGVTGFLVETGDCDGFVSSVRLLLEDPDLRERMGAAARQRSLEFGWDDPMRRILERYEALLQ